MLAGIEYDTKDAGHFIVIMPDHVKLRLLQIRGMSAERLIYIVHRFGGVLGPAHPFGQRSSSAMFFKKIKSKPQLLQKVDFVEGFNTCEKTESNCLAQLLGEKLGKPCTGGSDAHNEAYVGMAYTLIDRDITCNDDSDRGDPRREACRLRRTGARTHAQGGDEGRVLQRLGIQGI